jgi:hypothetical protein
MSAHDPAIYWAIYRAFEEHRRLILRGGAWIRAPDPVFYLWTQP